MLYPHLFSPLTVRGVTLKNRVDFPAMATKMGADGGYVTDALIDYHVARARGGCGLLTVEATSVHKPTAPRNFMSIADDSYLEGWIRFNEAVHAAGGKTCIQLWQGGIITPGQDPATYAVIPSDMPVAGGVVLPGATVETIAEIVQAWGEAAARAVAAGFDVLEFHAGHNYSPEMFLSPGFNRRTDEYGGSAENRMRYPLECIDAIRAAIPDDVPLMMRVSAGDDGVPGGNTVDDVIAFTKVAREHGVDMVNVSRGTVMSVNLQVPTMDHDRGFNVHNAAKFKADTGLVTVAVGRINDPQQAEDIIASGQADMVVMGRAQIADAEFCTKAMAGEEWRIIRCIGCNQGCFDRIAAANASTFPHISCLQNPAVGREAEFRIPKTDNPRTVLIAGGGIGGMEAAERLHALGHKPILCEASARLGGQFYMAGLAPRKQEMSDAALSRASTLEHFGVDVRLSTPVTPELIDQVAPDEVIIAIGSTPITLDLEGSDQNSVIDTETVLTGYSQLTGDVVVIGGGLVGLEVAEYLAQNDPRVTSVTVVEMGSEVGRDLGTLRKQEVMTHLALHEVATVVDTRCLRINAEGVVVEHDGEVSTIPATGVVVAVGSRSLDTTELTDHCLARKIPFHIIGDARSPRRAIDAVAEAAEVAISMR
ncbi:MAG: FAD-dependent oxidoreductase [Cellulomonas sp.]|uniref:bile acid Fe-S flavoenzyme BaiCD n=1 Tax=Cellulomonas sp. TaxID=40001 RepID=UPI001A05F3E8|nr:FAD-dependent oxidoreductase [Cellulomonas sp.]MBF0689071.1 FAD-dependent oxidoreductase [Cellulomonas sp.]